MLLHINVKLTTNLNLSLVAFTIPNSFDSLSVTQFNHATLIAWSYVCVLVLSTLPLIIRFSY
jgi:hypothetical protein